MAYETAAASAPPRAYSELEVAHTVALAVAPLLDALHGLAGRRDCTCGGCVEAFRAMYDIPRESHVFAMRLRRAEAQVRDLQAEVARRAAVEVSNNALRADLWELLDAVDDYLGTPRGVYGKTPEEHVKLARLHGLMAKHGRRVEG